LDLGSGPVPAPGYTGVDILAGTEGIDSEGLVYANLWNGEKWPWNDESIDALRASHLIEHIPHYPLVKTGHARRLRRTRRTLDGSEIVEHSHIQIYQHPFYWFFDEAWRVLKPGGFFEILCPDASHEHADQDPTHTRRICVSTFQYLTEQGRRVLRCNDYSRHRWILERGARVATDPPLHYFARRRWGDDVPIENLDPQDWREVQEEGTFHVNVFHEIHVILKKPGRVPDELPETKRAGFEPPPGFHSGA
jgi:hypothetical protein